MSWLKFDDRILRHPKFVRARRLAGANAFELWVGCVSYCKQCLSDGRVPADMIATVDGPDKRWRPRALSALVTVGLVEFDGGDLLVHDYLDWNPSRQEIVSKSAARKASSAAPGSVEGAYRGASKERTEERRRSVPRSVEGASAEENDNGHVGVARLRARSESESESESESIRIPPDVPPSDPSPAAPTPTKKKSSHPKAKRVCPADFEPTPAVLQLAIELGFSTAFEAKTRARMIDWSIGKVVAHGDWQATYRNWLRKTAEDSGLKPLVKHDAQREAYQAQLRAAATAPSTIAPVPREYAGKVRSLFS